MPGHETRVTKIQKLKDLKVSSESCLVMIAGPFLGKKYPLVDDDEFTIGREDKNFIVCDMDNVSRRHAQITHRLGKFFVQDLQSTNGTYLNGRRIMTPSPLRAGDKIFVGSFVLVLEGAKSVIVLATNYFQGTKPSTDYRIARYAWNDDYHDLIEKRLKALEDFLAGLGGTRKKRPMATSNLVPSSRWKR